MDVKGQVITARQKLIEFELLDPRALDWLRIHGTNLHVERVREPADHAARPVVADDTEAAVDQLPAAHGRLAPLPIPHAVTRPLKVAVAGQEQQPGKLGGGPK